MEVRELRRDIDGKRTLEIRCGQISFRSLLQTLKDIPDLSVADARMNPFNDEASAVIVFMGHDIELTTPFSDYWIEQGNCPDSVFDELISHLQNSPVRWWQRIV